MRILVVAPQPFYQERGTPIAVRLLIETLCEAGHRVDLLTYHEGQDVAMEGLEIIRIRKPPGVGHVPIGFSWQKLVCDGFLFFDMRRLARKNTYEVIHAVEEAIFLALLLRPRTRIKLVYDMDSSMAEQLIEKWRILRPFRRVFDALERAAVSRADLVLPVCQYLADRAQRHAPSKRIRVIEDIPLATGPQHASGENLRAPLPPNVLLALYVGNLEHYQGIDLMLDGLAQMSARVPVHLVIIGGSAAGIEHYRRRAESLKLGACCHFFGPRPLARLGQYLRQADVLISPRIKGGNTPMKIYSYLASGIPILATDIASHTQVLDSSCAVLVKPNPLDFAAGLIELAASADIRRRLGAAGARLAEVKYSRAAYKKKLLGAYATLSEDSVN